MDTSASPQMDDSLNDSLTDGEEDHSEGSPSPQVHTHTHTPCYKEGGSLHHSDVCGQCVDC